MNRNMIGWNFYTADIDDPSRIEEYLEETHQLGFVGVHMQLRDYRVQIDDDRVVSAVRHARDTARSLGLDFWLHLDPRDAVESFFVKYPDVKQWNLRSSEAPLENGGYQTWIDHSRPATDHKQHGVRFEFEALQRVFAFRVEHKTQLDEAVATKILGEKGYSRLDDRRGESSIIDSNSLVDITDTASYEPNSARSRVLVRGKWDPPGEGDWRVLAFVRLTMETFDYTSAEAIDFQKHLIDLYYNALDGDLDGILSDEPGTPTAYDYLTHRNGFNISERIFDSFRKQHRYDLRDELVKLIYDTSDGTASKVRDHYYRAFGDGVYTFQKVLKDYARKRFGEKLKVGIHCTAGEWCSVDLQRGSLDYWKMGETVTDGYTDGKHHDRYNGFFHVILAKSLAKLSESRTGFTQTWDIFPTAAGETYWTNVVTLYGLGWYPLGYKRGFFVDQMNRIDPEILIKRWENFGSINRKMGRAEEITRGAVAEANVLSIFPYETIINMGNEEANKLRSITHRLVYQLQTAHFQTDVVSPEVFASAKIKGGKLELSGQLYDAVVYPFPGCVPVEAFEQIKSFYEAGGKVLLFGCPPSLTPEGDDLTEPFSGLLGIEPITGIFDYFEPDPTTPYASTISFVGELFGAPTLNAREGLYASFSLYHYIWPVVLTEAAPVALNVRWEMEPNWIGAVRSNDTGGKMVFLGFDCTCVADGDRVFDKVLGAFGVPKLVEGPRGVWTSLIHNENRRTVLCCSKDALSPVTADLKAMGHTISVTNARDVFAISLDDQGAVVDVIAEGADRIAVDGNEVNVSG